MLTFVDDRGYSFTYHDEHDVNGRPCLNRNFVTGLHEHERDVYDGLRGLPEALLLRGGRQREVLEPGKI